MIDNAYVSTYNIVVHFLRSCCVYRPHQALYALNGKHTTVAAAVKKIHGLASPGTLIALLNCLLLPAETSYKSVYRDVIAGLENDSTLKLLKYYALRKLLLSTN